MAGLVGFVAIMTLYVAVAVGYGRFLHLTRWTDEDGIYKSAVAGAIWPYVMPVMLAVVIGEWLAVGLNTIKTKIKSKG